MPLHPGVLPLGLLYVRTRQTRAHHPPHPPLVLSQLLAYGHVLAIGTCGFFCMLCAMVRLVYYGRQRLKRRSRVRECVGALRAGRGSALKACRPQRYAVVDMASEVSAATRPEELEAATLD